ncbi:MAG: 2Fe-2S iron-sulfur cluster-binding protein [Stenotrophobium sp.]
MAFGRPRRVVIARNSGVARRWASGGHAVQQRPLRVVEIVRETPRAVTLVLEPDDGRPYHFRAGQYLTHCFEIDGQPHKRAYSMSAPEGGRLCCTVQLIEGGAVSEFIRTRLRPGDRYPAIGPTGDFVLDLESAAPLLFVAGGSGITPVISLIETALAARPARSLRLLYASRDEGSIIFRQRLDALAQRYAGLNVTHVLSQPAAGWSGARGRLDEARRIRELLGEQREASAYLCGPQGLMDAADAALRDCGVPAERIRRERFLAAPRVTQNRPTQPQSIFFQQSQRKIRQRVGESILDAGLREDVALRYSCTVGGCAACRVRVVSGAVSLSEPNCLTPEERAQGYTLACSAYALEPVVIEA